ncbi:hypothetical protein MSAN_02047500 [Mycena sanguinolenta]|uniref:F-box domain-containing protein n=1 Tax=Mycena sanguinolenta TaxID=230812 RepID=A0A8H6XK27_9AGAR|nr:hypothetical protein MSAN_02047500 [Mycena sanguinolenta]
MDSVLGLDLILEVLDRLAVPLHFHQRSCDLSVLVACSTVCKAWSSHAQRLLFRRVILPSSIYRKPFNRGIAIDPLPSFLAAIDPETERGRWLAESVVSLTLRLTGRSLTADSAALATALLRTPNLRHLDVTTVFCNFEAETVTRLREFGPRLTSLSIVQDSAPSLGHHTFSMHQLVTLFPSIRLLEITSNFNSTLQPFDPPPNLSLASAKFNTTLATDIGPCLASLLNPEADVPLQVLWHRSKTSRPSSLGNILRVHGPRLRSISFRSVDLAELAEYTALERFEFLRFPDAATVASIPRSIVALAIYGMPENRQLENGEHPDVVRFAQALSTFPHLKVLSWPTCSEPTMFSLLQEVCRVRGIELRTSPTELYDDNAIELELKRKYIRI